MDNRTEPILETTGLKKMYEIPTGTLTVLKGVDFELFAGEMAFIVGRSGSGKSTLMHLLGGLDKPSAGRVLFQGDDLAKMSEKELCRLRNRNIGLVFQYYYLLPELTLYENVLIPSIIAGNKDTKWAKELLKRVKLWSRRDHYPSELSGGEEQRTAIARALINRPAVVLCDEPTGNLDEETAEEVYRLLSDLNQQDNHSFLIVTHDATWAWRYARVLKLQDGVLMRDNRGEVQVEQAQ